MASSAQPITLGPFTGGLNTQADPSAIADTDLAECINLELDNQGTALAARPPLVGLEGPVTTTKVTAIGNAVFGSESYVILANATGVWAYKLSDGSFTTITSTAINPTCAIQYNGFVWIIARPGSAVNGGKWAPTSAFATVSGMPKGGAAVIYKERMWIAPGQYATSLDSRLYFSNIASPDSWTTSTDYFDISPGDGQKLMDLVVLNNNLAIFKSDSTYVLTYSTAPTDGTVVKANNTIGTTRQFCMQTYENSVYVLHEGKVYKMDNYNFVEISNKVPFNPTVLTPGTYTEEMHLSKVGDRLIVRFFDKTYAYGLKTNSWSEWQTKSPLMDALGPIVEHPNILSTQPYLMYVAGQSINDRNFITSIWDGHTSDRVESTTSLPTSMTCKIKTKNYDFGLGYQYKKLKYWGADILTTRTVIGTASPITFGISVTWADVGIYTWDELGSWASPLITNPDIATNVEAVAGSLRRFIKFLKALRFRQVNFTVEMETNGSTLDGPCRLYTVTIFATPKQFTSKQVS
jgi:hypothetical protein